MSLSYCPFLCYKISWFYKNYYTSKLTFTTLWGHPWWLTWMCTQLVIRGLQVPPLPGQQHSFVDFDHEILSMVILSLQMIQEGQLSVRSERMCTILVNYACPVKV